MLTYGVPFRFPERIAETSCLGYPVNLTSVYCVQPLADKYCLIFKRCSSMFCVVSIIYEYSFRLLCKIISKSLRIFIFDKMYMFVYNECIEKSLNKLTSTAGELIEFVYKGFLLTFYLTEL